VCAGAVEFEGDFGGGAAGADDEDVVVGVPVGLGVAMADLGQVFAGYVEGAGAVVGRTCRMP